MLKIVLHANCEKVLVGNDGVPSLINIFSRVQIRVPEGTTMPPNAVTPKDWAVFSLWETEPGDEVLEYYGCSELHYPDGTLFGGTIRTKLNIEQGRRTQLAIANQAFPIGQAGEHKVRTWIELDGKPVAEAPTLGIILEMSFEPSGSTPALPTTP